MIRVATFNLNNLFDRFNFNASVPEAPRVTATYRFRLNADRDVLPPLEDSPTTDDEGSPIIEGTGPVSIQIGMGGRVVGSKPEAHVQALVTRVQRLNANVLAVQEVENIGALREFNASLNPPYEFLALLEGNDPRFIDVGLLSRLPIGAAISHRWEPDPATGRFLFSRDLLAVELLNGDRSQRLLTVWIAHLKSKFVDPKIEDPAAIAAEQQNHGPTHASGPGHA